MHGFLWVLHKSHHEPRKGFWELNDVFGIFFAGVSVALFAWGVTLGGPAWTIPVALGITAYGVVYFLAHDALVHHRMKLGLNPRRGYLRRLYQAHRLHHAVDGRDGCVSFGFVFARSPEHLKRKLAEYAPAREQQHNKIDAKRVLH
jgi:beta-carotene 3-hydroxylase